VRHEYYVTVPMPGMTADLPCLRIPDLTLYARARDGGLLLGGWEPDALHTDPRNYSMTDAPPKIEPDWKVVEQLHGKITAIVPHCPECEAGTVGKGWPTFTPDGRFIIAKARALRVLSWRAAATRMGFLAPRASAVLLVQSLRPNKSDNVKSLTPDRFTEAKWTWDDACRKARAVYETYYGV